MSSIVFSMNPRNGLTPAQRRVYVKTVNLIRQMGYPPSLREIARETGTSANAVRSALLILERKGYVGRADTKFRSIRILKSIQERG